MSAGAFESLDNKEASVLHVKPFVRQQQSTLNIEKKEETRPAWAQAVKEYGGQSKRGGRPGQLADAVSFTNIEKGYFSASWRASITGIHSSCNCYHVSLL
jgi:hypothetical protein